MKWAWRSIQLGRNNVTHIRHANSELRTQLSDHSAFPCWAIAEASVYAVGI
jgi:hypothetical protein